MKITVLQGSPKLSQYSVTMQYIYYLREKFKEIIFNGILESIEFEFFKILSCTRSEKKYKSMIQSLRNTNAILWAFPVYTFSIPSHMIRFFEIIEERGDTAVFQNIHTTSITTSIKVFDHAAHNYVRYIADRWGMQYQAGFTAVMHDLTDKHIRVQFEKMFKLFLFNVKSDLKGLEPPIPQKLISGLFKYQKSYQFIPSTSPESLKTQSYKALIIRETSIDENINQMINIVIKSLHVKPKILSLDELHFSPCMGCVNCVVDGKCIIDDSFREEILRPLLNADIIIFGLKIKELGFNTIFKQFLDRLIVMGHGPFLIWKPAIGFLISGSLSVFPYLKEGIEAYFQQKGVKGIVFATDQPQNNDIITKNLHSLVVRLEQLNTTSTILPKNYLGESSDMLLEDFVLNWKGVLPEDLKFYKKYNLFRKKNKFNTMKQAILIPMLKTEVMKKMVKKNAMKIIVQPLQNLISKLIKSKAKGRNPIEI